MVSLIAYYEVIGSEGDTVSGEKFVKSLIGFVSASLFFSTAYAAEKAAEFSDLLQRSNVSALKTTSELELRPGSVPLYLIDSDNTELKAGSQTLPSLVVSVLAETELRDALNDLNYQEEDVTRQRGHRCGLW